MTRWGRALALVYAPHAGAAILWRRPTYREHLVRMTAAMRQMSQALQTNLKPAMQHAATAMAALAAATTRER